MAEQKKGWFSRLTEGLSRSSKQMTEQVVSVLTKMKLDEDALAALEESLIEAERDAWNRRPASSGERLVKLSWKERSSRACRLNAGNDHACCWISIIELRRYAFMGSRTASFPSAASGPTKVCSIKTAWPSPGWPASRHAAR